MFGAVDTVCLILQLRAVASIATVKFNVVLQQMTNVEQYDRLNNLPPTTSHDAEQ